MVNEMPQDGYLVISDISGYSKYLHESELDHARDSLNDLLNLLVEHTRSPLRIVELEGDAVFSYAPAEEVTSAGILTGMVKDCYVAFRRALDLMVINTTCDCRACRLLPTLDLKFFVHYGSFARQKVVDHHKLVGNDVNLIHRLLKNSVSETTGLQAYAAYTESAVEQLRLDRAVEGLVSHAEIYEDVGEIGMCVKDMHGIWKQARDRNRLRITDPEADGVWEAEFSLPVEEMWRYVTDPVTRNIFSQSDWQELERRPDGEAGPGATYVCAHGDSKVLQTIVDWEPPRSYTIRTRLPFPVTCLYTTELVAEGEGTRLRMLSGQARGPLLWRQVWLWIGTRMFTSRFQKGVHVLKQRIRQNHEGDLFSGHAPSAGEDD